jgi:hypothetical protein
MKSCMLGKLLMTKAISNLHSALYIGGVYNPINALIQLLDSFHSESGEETVEGFYERVLPLTDEEKQAYLDLNFNEEKQRPVSPA